MSAPSTQSEFSDPSLPAEKARAWRILHACESVRSVLLLTEGQLSVGMKPYVITRSGKVSGSDILRAEAPAGVSLINLWQDVRQWRRSILECEPQQTLPNQGFELVHAHSFASGMAAVRNCPAVVYDVTAFIENQSRPSINGADESWLGRSFRVAEQFVLTRCGATVVHSSAAREGAHRRGAASANVFSIPFPIPPEVFEAEALNEKQNSTPDAFQGVTILAPEFRKNGSSNGSPLSDRCERILEAFAKVYADHKDVRLLVRTTEALIAPLRERTTALGISESVRPLRSGGHVRANIVIADQGEFAAPPVGDETSDEMQPEFTPALRTMLAGRTLLAADCPENRDVSPDGRGLLWYVPGDVRDLAARLTFLIENPDLRASLAATGKKFILETRTPEAVARQYDRVYRHAFGRRKAGGQGVAPGAGRLEPITASF